MITVIISYKICLSIYFGEKMKNFLLFSLAICLVVLPSCNKGKSIVENNEIERNHKMIATWINYNEIKNLISDLKTDFEFEQRVTEKVNTLKEYGINTIFLQVRAFDDSFYISEISPISRYSKNDYKEFDVLNTFIQVCAKRDVSVHAWINPYRISNSSDIQSIQQESIAYEIITSDENDERIIKTENCLYYNPSYTDIQSYILCCIREILLNYNVDGIHIDDYFYPTTDKKIDEEIYAEYISQGGKLSLEDFRRININSLVSSIYFIVKNYNKDLVFTISPAADIEKNYNNLYADVVLWASENGYADYIIPQLYYGYYNENMPFEELLDEWTGLESKYCKIISGLSLYKCGKEDVFAGKGKNEWIENKKIIYQQMNSCIEYGTSGIAFYSASVLYNNSEDIYFNKITDIVNNWNSAET